MKDKLELKHLAPYLPYELKMCCPNSNIKIQVLKPFDIGGYMLDFLNTSTRKPILRPLSDLTKEIEHNGEIFIPIDYLKNNYSGFYFDSNPELLIKSNNTNLYISLQWSVEFYNKLLEWHFDVFSLIEKGLAIDKNKI